MAKTLSRPKGGNTADRLVGELISELLNASTVTHKLHLLVKGEASYAQHAALNEFYAGIKDSADSLAEQYQGHKLILLEIKAAPMEGILLKNVDDCIKYLDSVYMMVSKTQDMMTCSSIVNEMDNIKSLINSTKYKLFFLA